MFRSTDDITEFFLMGFPFGRIVTSYVAFYIAYLGAEPIVGFVVMVFPSLIVRFYIQVEILLAESRGLDAMVRAIAGLWEGLLFRKCAAGGDQEAYYHAYEGSVVSSNVHIDFP